MTKTDFSRPTGAPAAEAAPMGLLGLDSLLQAQAQLWNQMLDANRTLWSFYAPWLQATPWLLNGAAIAAESEEKGLEPATTADGLPDAFELQARSWNRLLDAQRTFWTSLNWPMTGMQIDDGAPAAEAANAEVAEPASATGSRSSKRSKTSRSAGSLSRRRT